MIRFKTPIEIIRDQVLHGEWHVGDVRVFTTQENRERQAVKLETVGFELERFVGQFGCNYYFRVKKVPYIGV